MNIDFFEQYEKEVHVFHHNNKAVTVENLFPKGSDQEQVKMKKNIQKILYDVFRKYQ
ncbi:MAG: hypothetical protein K0R90_454 [Oscillospiraceae bacterium]|nr:hypothetical protein [Oscillospiraceae bacterium]